MSPPGYLWRRPAHVPVPTVWRRCEGRLPLPDGRRPRFVIQDAPPALDDAVVRHMVTHFLRDENVCALSGAAHDPATVRDFEGLWRELLEQRVVLVALLEDGEAGGAARIAGVNMTGVLSQAEKDHEVKLEGASAKRVWAAYEFIQARAQPEPFARYGVDRYLTALGLSVDPEFRGQGLGEELLKARWDLCKAFDVPLTVTWFTGIASQKLAERVGFETIAEYPYAEYDDPDFKKSKTPMMKLMAARISET